MSSATDQTQLMTTSVNIRKDLGATAAEIDNDQFMHSSQMMMSNVSMTASVYVEPEIYQNTDFKSEYDAIDVKGPLFKKESLVTIGYYIFTLSVTRRGETVTVDRRYSDFDKLRKAIECLYPGFFVPVLPPKDMGISF